MTREFLIDFKKGFIIIVIYFFLLLKALSIEDENVFEVCYALINCIFLEENGKFSPSYIGLLAKLHFLE